MTYTLGTKHSSSASRPTKHSSSYSDQGKTLINSFLLKEDGFYLLLETGDKIILDQNIPSPQTYITQTKY